jgi:hypothetical protein
LSEVSEKPVRMTVTKLGHKIDDLTEVIDLMHNDVLELKSALKSLIELQKELLSEKPATKPQDSGFKGMFG